MYFILGVVWSAGAVAMFVCSATWAPVFTYDVLAGRADGEFYAERFTSLTALGWWILLWATLLAKQALRFICSRCQPRPASPAAER